MSANIGTRWKPGHVIRRDTETGDYCEINSPMRSATEWFVQQAMLAKRVIPTRPSVWARVVRVILNLRNSL